MLKIIFSFLLSTLLFCGCCGKQQKHHKYCTCGLEVSEIGYMTIGAKTFKCEGWYGVINQKYKHKKFCCVINGDHSIFVDGNFHFTPTKEYKVTLRCKVCLVLEEINKFIEGRFNSKKLKSKILHRGKML